MDGLLSKTKDLSIHGRNKKYNIFDTSYFAHTISVYNLVSPSQVT